MSEKRFHYRAHTLAVVDGDTVRLDIDLGFGLWLRNQTCRLLGINAPEKNTPEGVAAKAHLGELLHATQPTIGDVFVVTELDRDEKYGRTLVVLYADALFRPPSLNKRMVTDGHAVPYDGGKR